MILRQFGECAEVYGTQYSLNLFTLAESIKARSILELGAGWGWSSRAFALSLENRLPSKLTSIDIHPERIKRDNRKAVLDTNVDWDIIAESTSTVEITDDFDLIYVDANPNQAHADFLRFYPRLNPGGLIIMDGYDNQPGPTSAVDSLSNQYPFMYIQYYKCYIHAIHRKPITDSGKRGIRTVCKQCAETVNYRSWREADSEAYKHAAVSLHKVAVTVEERGLHYMVFMPKGA